MAQEWWSEEYDFFGDFYIEGDDSVDGYLINKKQSLAERTQVEIDGVINLLSLSKNAKILDCPCGYGRHSVPLAKKGFVVTGVDINSHHLAKAREAADDATVSFVKESMSSMNFVAEFDAAINMFYSFGFFETDEENENVLRNFFNSLKSGGLFLMHTDVNIPRILNGKYKEDETRKLNTGKTLRVIDNYNSETKRIDGSWIITDSSGKQTRKDYSVRVYTKDEFISMCEKIGFSSCEVYADWEKAPYSENSEDMIIVARK